VQITLEDFYDVDTHFWNSINYIGVCAQLAQLHRRAGSFEYAVKIACRGLAVLENKRVRDPLEDPDSAWGYRVVGECYTELGLAFYILGYEWEAHEDFQKAMVMLQHAGDIDYDVLLLCIGGSAAVLGDDEDRSVALCFCIFSSRQ
jgi:hypothetical protein